MPIISSFAPRVAAMPYLGPVYRLNGMASRPRSPQPPFRCLFSGAGRQRAAECLALKNGLQVRRIGPEILLHVTRVGGIARAFNHQPALPADVGQRLLDLLHVEAGVVLQPHAVFVGG
nr:hypothetical protein [Tanacetum cinerariifolium]